MLWVIFERLGKGVCESYNKYLGMLILYYYEVDDHFNCSFFIQMPNFVKVMCMTRYFPVPLYFLDYQICVDMKLNNISQIFLSLQLRLVSATHPSC